MTAAWQARITPGCFLLHRQDGRGCRAAELIDLIQELLNLYLPLSYLRIDTGLGLTSNALQNWCIGSDCLRYGLNSTGLAMGKTICGVMPQPVQHKLVLSKGSLAS